MSTDKSWGLFKADGTPVATGNDWHSYRCPNKRWERPEPIEHWATGEMIQQDPVEVPCPFKYMGAKMDRCEKCGIEFHYP